MTGRVPTFLLRLTPSEAASTAAEPVIRAQVHDCERRDYSTFRVVFRLHRGEDNTMLISRDMEAGHA